MGKSKEGALPQALEEVESCECLWTIMEVFSGGIYHSPKTQSIAYLHLRMELLPAQSGCQGLIVFSDSTENISTITTKRFVCVCVDS